MIEFPIQERFKNMYNDFRNDTVKHGKISSLKSEMNDSHVENYECWSLFLRFEIYSPSLHKNSIHTQLHLHIL